MYPLFTARDTIEWTGMRLRFLSSTILARWTSHCRWCNWHPTEVCQFRLLFLRSGVFLSDPWHLWNIKVNIKNRSNTNALTAMHFLFQGASIRSRVECDGEQPIRILYGLLHSFVSKDALQRKIAAILFAVSRGVHLAWAHRWRSAKVEWFKVLTHKHGCRGAGCESIQYSHWFGRSAFAG